MTEEYRLNLITGMMETVTEDQQAREEGWTERMKLRLGNCDYACRYTEPFGWVPEAGCPVHDK